MKLRAALIACLLVIATSVSRGQGTVTATVTDSDSTVWANCAYSISYYSTTPGAPTEISTGQTAPTSYTGTCNGSGVISRVIVNSNNIFPSGSGWVFTVCPAITNANCYSTAPISTTGSQSVSTQINAVIIAPRVTGGIGVSAYADVEVASLPNNSYYNVTTATLRCYGSSWAVCGSSSSGGFPFILGSTSIAASSTNTSVAGLTVDGVTPTTFGFVDATSSIQAQFNALTAALPVSGSGTYTAAASDDFTVTGATSSSHCTFSPTNTTAAAATVVGFISSVATNLVTITHVATTASGGTVDIVCTVN